MSGKKIGSTTPRLDEMVPATIRMPPLSERAPEDRPLGRTLKLGSSAMDEPPPSSDEPLEGARFSELPSSVQGITLVVVEENQIVGGERRAWRAAEVWTKRRVYGLDSTFRCIEVLDRLTGRPEADHEMLGARLGGGRMRQTSKVRFSYPLPLAGMEAMFSKGKKHGYTSPVERIVVRVRLLNTSADEASPSWDDIASRWSEPPSSR
jgi:hypothetical protein